MRHLVRLFLGVTCLFTAGSLGAGASGRAVEVGRIELATAGVTVASAEIRPLKPDAAVQVGDLIRTGPAGAARLALAGGASALIQPSTELRVVKHDTATAHTTIELVRGHVLVQSQPDAPSGADLRVETATAVAFTKQGAINVSTAPAPLGLGTMSLVVKVSDGGTPVANAAIKVVVSGIDQPVPVGTSNGQGDADVTFDFVRGATPDRPPADPLIDYLRFVKQDFRAVIEECDGGGHTLFLVGEDGRLPDAPRRCRRQRMAGVFLWNARKRVSVDTAGRTVRAADIEVERPAATAVGTTIVTSFDGQVTLASRSTAAALATFLLPGQTGAVDAGGVPSPAVAFDHPQLLMFAGLRADDRDAWHVPARLIDFTASGQSCEPAWVVDGVVSRTRARFDIEIRGNGTSTGEAFVVQATNESDCAVYFMVTDGTILNARGMARRVVLSLITGSVPPLETFQRMITVGIFIRLSPGVRDVTVRMRAYCVELHKLAPHQRVEFQVAGEDDQIKFGFRRPIVDEAFRLSALKRLTSTTGHNLDVVIQWALWTHIEGLDLEKFTDEFTKLARKNIETQKKRWDDAAKKFTAAAIADMWRIIQIVAPTPTERN